MLTMLPHLLTWNGFTREEQAEVMPFVMLAHRIVTNNRLSKIQK